MPAPITDSSYALEIFQGPVLAPVRVTGLGGAYTALAEGVEGSAVNAAAPAVRDPFSTAWLESDISFGASFLGSFAKTDFDNRGDTELSKARVGDFISLDLGAQMQLGRFGACFTGGLQEFNISSNGPTQLSLQIGRFRVVAAYGFFRGQLLLGAGLRAITMQIVQGTGFDPRNGSFIPGGNTLFTMSGAGPEAGALWMPDGRPWRIGGTLRAPVSGTPGIGQTPDVPLILPREVVLPWEAEIGLAYQLGPRPLNPPWIDPHDQEARVRRHIDADRAHREAEYAAELARAAPDERDAIAARQKRVEAAVRELEDQRLDAEIARLRGVRKARYKNWPREKILLLASVLFTGSSNDAVSVAGFLDQRKELVGRTISVTPHFGIEGEPVVDRLRARLGTYTEPSRYADSFFRQHFTFGADIKLFSFEAFGLLKDAVWMVNLYLDIAPRFTNGGIGIGLWR